MKILRAEHLGMETFLKPFFTRSSKFSTTKPSTQLAYE
jgi:hypothetical protein